MQVLAANGAFVALSPVPEELLSAAFRGEVFKFPVAKRALSEALAQHMLGWRHSGFSVHKRVRCVAFTNGKYGDPERRKLT